VDPPAVPARPVASTHLARRHNLIRPRLMRHVLSLVAVRTLPCRVGQPTLLAGLVALSGRSRGLTPGLLRAALGAVDLAAVAAAADQHQSTTAFTRKQPRRGFHWRMLMRTWTTSATFATRRPHACTTRCEARRRARIASSGRRRACHFRQVVTSPSCADARCHARSATTASINLIK
jgi:hypothetical protein